MKKLLLASALAGLLTPALPAFSASYYTPKPSAYSQQQQNQQGADPMSTLQQSYNNSTNPFGLYGSDDDKKNKPAVINQYSDRYKKNITQDEKELPKLLPGMDYTVRFIRAPGAHDGQALLSIYTPLAVTGCLKMKQPEVAIRENGQTLSLDITDAGIELDKSVRYAHILCNIRNQYAHIDLPLDRRELLDKGINKVTLRNANGGSRDITLDVTENRITALASGIQTKNAPHGTPGAGGIATYWFYPENTVVLTVPGQKLNSGAQTALTDLAKNSGLEPLQASLAGFESARNDALYFTDASGHVTKQVAGGPVPFGTIESDEIYYGPNGQYKTPVNLQVFARVPGENE